MGTTTRQVALILVNYGFSVIFLKEKMHIIFDAAVSVFIILSMCCHNSLQRREKQEGIIEIFFLSSVEWGLQDKSFVITIL